MSMVPIPLTGGAFQNVDAMEVSDPSAAVALENFLLDDGGANVDRPGLGPTSSGFAALGVTSPIIGLHYFEAASILVAVTDARRIYSISSTGTVTDITGVDTLDGTSRPVFDEDGTYLAIAGGGVPQRWNGSGTCAGMPGSPVNCS